MTRRRACVTGWLVLAAAAACAAPVAPRRAAGERYPFAYPTGLDSTGQVVDSIIFRWPQDRMPLRVWADPRGNMRDVVSWALGEWDAQLLYGEVTTTLVADSASADIQVRWLDSVPPAVAPDTGPYKAGSCAGDNVLPAVDSTNHLVSAVVDTIAIVPFAGATAARVQACVRRVVLHELGHALGLLVHSPDSTDVMYGQALVTEPTLRDRNTIEVLYHTKPNVFPAPRAP